MIFEVNRPFNCPPCDKTVISSFDLVVKYMFYIQFKSMGRFSSYSPYSKL